MTLDEILERIRGPFNDLIYVGKGYTLADLEMALRALQVDVVEQASRRGLER